MKSKDLIQRQSLLDRWERLLSRNDVSPARKAFIRLEIQWLRAWRPRAKAPGGLGK